LKGVWRRFFLFPAKPVFLKRFVPQKQAIEFLRDILDCSGGTGETAFFRAFSRITSPYSY
jgi:hypothetical protein